MLNDIIILNIKDYLFAGCDAKQPDGESELREIISSFHCSKNLEVENFFKQQAIIFTKKNQSVTYLVLSAGGLELLGYFTIAIKPIVVNASGFSNTVKRKIARVSQYNQDDGTYTLSAYLIAQLGKNFLPTNTESITGAELLEAAIETIREIQHMAGGTIIFLETDGHEKLLHFYEQENQFKQFSTRATHGNGSELLQMLRVL